MTGLYQALAEFQKDPPTLTKNRAGQVGNQKTRYADLVQVNETVLSRLNALGIVYITQPTLVAEGKFVLGYQLRHVESGEVLNGEYPLKLSENPQQMGSAITYARRYVLLALTGVAAEDEDDDGQQGGRPTAQRAQRTERAGGTAGRTAQRASGTAPPLPGEAATDRITEPQMRKLQALFAEHGYSTPDDKRAFLVGVIGHELASTRELTKREAMAAIDRLEKRDDPGGDA
jgi:hypothetical protein